MPFGQIVSRKLWGDALTLLDEQLKLFVHKRYKHFNTLSFIYYASVMQDGGRLATDDYYAFKVASGLFYGLRHEFAIYGYLKPKRAFGLRDYRFLSYPMRVLYYAVGLYFVQLSQEFLDGYYRLRKNVHTFYGADLRYSSGKLLTKPDRLLFYEDYKRFRSLLRKQAKVDPERLVIKLDIQNYFDNISIPTLLRLLCKNIKQSEQQKYNFNVDNQSELRTFFEFVSRGRSGIPQSDNDVVSSFLGHLFLCFGDLAIDDEIRFMGSGVLRSHEILRYMDDTYLVLNFQPGFSSGAKRMAVVTMMERITDHFYYELGLKINEKTRLYWLDTQEGVDDLLQSIKKISPKPIFLKPQDNATPDELQEAVDDIFEALRRLKQVEAAAVDRVEPFCNEEALKEIFDKRISALLDKEEHRQRLANIFADYDWELTKLAPAELILLLMKDPARTESFREHLLQKARLSTRDTELITTLLCHDEQHRAALIDRLVSDDVMAAIAHLFKSAMLIPADAGYHGLSETGLRSVAVMQVVIEQIKLRILNEDLGRYSVALNHLVNEFQRICIQLDGRGKDLDSNDIVEFLQRTGLKHELCLAIRKLFDRRNLNQVSHASGGEVAAWGVSEQEYAGYKESVSLCLKALLQ
jgi:AbiA family abortive infection protein